MEYLARSYRTLRITSSKKIKDNSQPKEVKAPDHLHALVVIIAEKNQLNQAK
jgi:hypothetical protein